MEDDNNKIIINQSINLNIVDSSISQGFFSFFLPKKTVVSICPYKDNIIILMNDYTLIFYEILNKSKKIEINNLEKFNPIEIKILYYQIPIFNKDYLFVLCEKNILLLNITSFLIEYEFSLKEKAISSELFVLNNIYFLLILFEYKIILYNINVNIKENCLLGFNVYQELSLSDEKIISMKAILNTNLIFYQTEKKLKFFLFKTKYNLNSKEIIFDKEKNFKSQIPNIDDLNNLEKKLLSLYEAYKSDKFKSLDTYKNIIIDYTKISDYFVIAIYNKLFIIKSFYDKIKNDIIESNFDIKKGENEFKFLDRITKPNVIISTKIIEPYIILIYEKKIFFYSIFEHNKCIYQTNIEPNFDFIFYKPMYLLSNLHLLNYSDDMINYNDEFLLKDIAKKNKDDLSLNSRPIIYTYHNKDNKLFYFCFDKFLLHFDIIKKINIIYSSKLLSILDYNRENRDENSQYYNRDIEKKNRKYVEYKVIELFLEEIQKNNYENAISIYNDNKMNIIFILILIKNFIQSNILNNLLVLTLFEYIYKVNFDYKKLNLNIIKNHKDKCNKKNIYKFFFDIIMKKRNDIKNNFSPQEIKYISFDNISIELKLNEIKKGIELDIENYNNYIEIIKLIERRNENIINFILLENIIFVLNFYSYKETGEQKFLSNLFGLISMSINILDPNIIQLLKENNLNNLILLFYFSKGDYEQCFNNIKLFYENAPSTSNTKETEIYSISDVKFFDDILSLNKGKNESINNKTMFENQSLKLYWFRTYIYLISKLFSKVKEIEFNEKIKWALKENSNETIDLLIHYKIINNQKVNYSFIDLLNPFGLDPIIHYFSKFSNLKEGKSESNEIINLYSIKIKLLSDKNKNINNKNKFKNDIEDANNKLCKFLIKNKIYDVDKAYERIMHDIPFCQKEIGILLIKKNEYELGLNKLLELSNLSNKNDIDLIFLLVEEIPSYEFIIIVLKKIKQIKFTDYTNDSIILQILSRLTEHNDILINILNTDILDDYNNEQIADFFINNIFSVEKDILYNKIETSLIGSQILDNKNILYDKQGESSLINYKTICYKCKKCIYEKYDGNNKSKEFEDYAVKISNGKIFHIECFQN